MAHANGIEDFLDFGYFFGGRYQVSLFWGFLLFLLRKVTKSNLKTLSTARVKTSHYYITSIVISTTIERFECETTHILHYSTSIDNHCTPSPTVETYTHTYHRNPTQNPQYRQAKKKTGRKAALARSAERRPPRHVLCFCSWFFDVAGT